MAVYVMLTVDLNRDVSAEARQKFNEHLAGAKWTKLKLTTTWYAKFKDGTTTDGAISETKADVKRAADQAGIRSYEAAAEAGEAAPAAWST